MAGKGTTGLRSPQQRYDPRGRAGFETRADSALEDRRRARRLRRTALSRPELAQELLALADAIDPDVTAHSTSPASSRWMRRYRRRLVGALWTLYDEA